MNKFVNYVLISITILLIILFVLFILDVTFAIEVEQYSIGMEITHAEQYTQHNYIYNYNLKTSCYSGSTTFRTFYLCGDDIVTSVNVDRNTYALYKVGDWVEVEYTIYKSFILRRDIEEIQILGAMIEN